MKIIEKVNYKIKVENEYLNKLSVCYIFNNINAHTMNNWAFDY